MYVPYNRNRNTFETFEGWNGEYEQLVVGEFPATMRYVEAERGRSAVTFWFERTDDGFCTKYPFRLTEFEKVFKRSIDGTICGHFKFNKRGASYSCELLPPINFTYDS
jgi:hypothetical protein